MTTAPYKGRQESVWCPQGT